jgi:O-antigen/teichoic acid export membrane protein
MADQVLLSAATLAVGVLLARTLDPGSYGEFTLAYALVVLLGGLYNSFIIEPMSILGPARHGGVPRAYFATLVLIHLALSGCLLGVVGLGLVVAEAAGVVRMAGMSKMTFFLASAAVTPAMMFFWLVRRRAYAMFTVSRAMRATVAYSLCLIGGVSALGWSHILTLSGSLWVLVAASLCGVLVDTWGESAVATDGLKRRSAGSPFGAVWREHWTYGSWAVLASMVYWGSGYLYYYLTGTLVGLTGVASLRVAAVCLQPARTIQAGLINGLLPRLAGARRAHDQNAAFRRQVHGAGLCLVALTVTYGVVVTMAGGWMLRVLYGGRYDDAAVYVWLFAICAIIDSLGESAVLGLKALEEPKLICVGYAIGTAVAVLVGIPAIRAFGTMGAAYAVVGSSAASAASVWLMYSARVRQGAATPDADALRESSAFGTVDM